MTDHKKAVIYALVSCMIWGTVYVAIKSGLSHGFRPLTFAGARFVAGGLILMMLSAARGVLKMSFRDVLVVSALGFLQTGVQNALFFVGVDLTGAGISAILINTQPFFVMMLAPLFFRSSRLTTARVLGVAVGFSGVLLTMRGHGLGSGRHELGVIALVLSAFTWALSNIAAKKVMKGRDTLSVTGVQMFAGALPLLVLGLAVEGPPFISVDTTGLMILGYLVVFATSIPFFTWYRALELGEVGRVSVFAFTLPVLGVLSGWLILGEPLSWNVFAGMALVAGGIVVVNRA